MNYNGRTQHTTSEGNILSSYKVSTTFQLASATTKGSTSFQFRLSLVNASLSATVTVMVMRRHEEYVDGLYSLDHDNLYMMLYRYNQIPNKSLISLDASNIWYLKH
jgi:hypothetical protein